MCVTILCFSLQFSVSDKTNLQLFVDIEENSVTNNTRKRKWSLQPVDKGEVKPSGNVSRLYCYF